MSTTPTDSPGDPPAPPPPPRPTFLRRHRSRILAGVALFIATVGGVAFFVRMRQSRLPGPGEPVYERYVESFEVGVAALDVDVWPVAEENFDRAIVLIPQEPAGW